MPNWTRERPTEPGHYWMTTHITDEPVLVRLRWHEIDFAHPNDLYLPIQERVLVAETPRSFVIDNVISWYGPITPPPLEADDA